ncbi:thymidylate synthase [Providencia phage vB_PreS_PR1]|uniref:Thymidylate synthase n=1 Tax=Providencia phage vB_PreS_PR1 TaxID=1931407 RepID=A0A1S6KUW9_9CAUD|nr:thymidylate synthase [Providencia phage vB_PreS_PR1]AQT25230.1 thymidylate synthase [Providencia phage vB_PreS_PR1]
MKQYLDLAKRIMKEGTMVPNERTGVGCLTVINADLEYDVANNKFPMLTTRKVNFKAAVAELLGYLRGYDNADQFASIGCNTWHANANDNAAWLANPNRKGHGDMGRVYGVQGRQWASPNGSVDQLQKVYDDLLKGKDDRGEIVTFWNPGEFELGCLRPCMHTHTFSLLDGVLYLTSYQRSCDVPLGLVFNQIQCFVLCALMAQITGHKAGKAYHKIVNAHIYENQLETMNEQIWREPFDLPKLHINPAIKTLEDVLTWVTPGDFVLESYESHPPIKHPFTV